MADADTEKIHYIGRPQNSIAHKSETAAQKMIPQSAAEKLAIHQACAV
jgi:hypothetical protein